MQKVIQNRITVSLAPMDYFQPFEYMAELDLLKAEMTDGKTLPAATLVAYGQTEDQAEERLVQAWDFVAEKAREEY